MFLDNEIRRIKELLLKQTKGELGPMEEAELRKWAGSSPARQALIQELCDEHTLHEKLRAFAQAGEKDVWEHKKIWDVLRPGDDLGAGKRFSWRRYAAVFTLLLVGAATGYFIFLRPAGTSSHSVVESHHDIEPGGDKAVLTLADGTHIELDSAATGRLASQGNTTILKDEDGQLVYDARQASPDAAQAAWNTVATPRGGGYRLVLPDGSRVWLNSASSISFPAAFTGGERPVKVTGECYFEVAYNPDKPFKVDIADRMQAEVLGTSFNIMAHPDENLLATTLLEGSLLVNPKDGESKTGSQTINSKKQETILPTSRQGNKKLLKPGQQARMSAGAGGTHSELSVVRLTDPDEAIAWKNGLISFKNADIQHIMRQLSRWYDLQVTYKGNISAKYYSGRIKRNATLSEALEMLQLVSKARFEVNGREVTVEVPE